MEPERVDLSPLDLTEDQLAYERLVRRVMDAAGPELARRARAATPLALLSGWARPMLTAAAIIAALALGAIMATERPAGTAETGSMADALGVPAPAAEWLAEGREPTEADLVLAFGVRLEQDRFIRLIGGAVGRRNHRTLRRHLGIVAPLRLVRRDAASG